MDCSLLSMGFSRQEYCSGLPLPPPRDHPDPVGGFFTTAPPGKPMDFLKIVLKIEIISHELPRWLGIYLPMQETQAQSLLREDSTRRGAGEPACHSCWSCTLEPQLEKALTATKIQHSHEEIISRELFIPNCKRALHWHRWPALLWGFQVGGPLFSTETVDASLLAGLTVSTVSFLFHIASRWLTVFLSYIYF